MTVGENLDFRTKLWRRIILPRLFGPRSAVLGVWLWSGCSPQAETEKAVPIPSQGGVLSILHEEVGDLDPVLVDDVYEVTVSNQIFEGLVRFDKDMGLIPVLAQSWSISEDGRVYEFQLRQGVRFHNGEAFAAETVVRSFERILNPRKPNSCLAETYFENIRGAKEYRSGEAESVAGIRVLGPYAIGIELVEPMSFFLSVLAMDQTRIVPEEAGRDWFDPDHTPIGTGPFLFGQQDHLGNGESRISIHRNLNYWGTVAQLDSIEFLAYPNPDESMRLELLAAGTVDVAWVDSDNVPMLTAAGFVVRSAPELTVSFLGLQSALPPLDDLNIRQAIAHCVDRSSFAHSGVRDLILAEGILPLGLPGSSRGTRVLSYDPELAARLVRDSGYSFLKPAPSVTIYTSSRGQSYDWLKNDLAVLLCSIGIVLDIAVVPWPELDRKILAGEAPLFLLGWVADVPDPDGFLFPLFATGESNNLFGFSNPQVDSGLMAARELKQGEERRRLYREMEETILSQVAVVPLYHEVLLYAWNPAVQGTALGPQGLGHLSMNDIWLDSNRPVPEMLVEGGTR